MNLEYLFLDNKFKNDVENYKYQYSVIYKNVITKTINAKVKIYELPQNNAWVARIFLDQKVEQEQAARHLSHINNEMIQRYRPTILRNDSSAYYNQKLYPLANEFERELRRLLYIKNALYTGEKVKKNIESLESKDLGEIYNLLFVDEDFCKKAKELATGKKVGFPSSYARIQLIKELNSLPEITTWDVVIGKDNLTTIKNRFLDIMNYRNCIMHARNISYEDYKKHSKLFSDAIMQIENEVNNIVNYPDSAEKSEFVVDKLYEALNYATKNMKPISEMDVQAFSQALYELSKNIYLTNDTNVHINTETN